MQEELVPEGEQAPRPAVFPAFLLNSRLNQLLALTLAPVLPLALAPPLAPKPTLPLSLRLPLPLALPPSPALRSPGELHHRQTR